MTDDTGSSCSGQVAVFGGTSCTVNNIPSNSGTVSLTDVDRSQVIVIAFTVGITCAIIFVLNHFYTRCLHHCCKPAGRRSEYDQGTQPPLVTQPIHRIVRVEQPAPVKQVQPDIEIC